MPNQTFKTVFLSHKLSPKTVGYGGRLDFTVEQTLSIKNSDSCNQSRWTLNNHIGTHIDAGYHFSESGMSLDELAADFWIFKSPQLIYLPTKASTIIDVGTWCEEVSSTTDLLLLKTNFEDLREQADYWAHNPGLSPEFGLWLRKNRPEIRAVGFDFISLTSYDHRPLGRVAHHAFLHEENPGHPILIIEDMHLKNLQKSPLKVYVAPVRVEKTDGSPVTVIAEVEL